MNRKNRMTAYGAIALCLAGPVGATRSADVPAIGLAGAGAIIPSDSAGALEEPARWECDRIRPEYREYLRQGNKPEAWRFVGKTYRAISTGETYTWNDWLDWNEKKQCEAGAPPPKGSNTMLYAGGGLLLVGLLLAAMGGGGGGSSGGGGSGGPDSPG